MVLSGVLGKAYNALEGGFYKIMDFLETRGIPVYNYNDFLESKGIPVFPFTIAIIAILLTAISWFFFLAPGSASFTVHAVDSEGNAVNGIQLRVLADSGKELFNGGVDVKQLVL